MLRLTVAVMLLNVCSLNCISDDVKEIRRPISDADSVAAIYREDWGLASKGQPAIILAVWPDGHIVWSNNRLKGGAPYRKGCIDSKKFTALMSQLEKDGVFADEKLNHANFGPDSQVITMYIKFGKHKVTMCSWHELFEDSGAVVADHHGLSPLNGKPRLAILRKAPNDYLFFRFAWSETRAKMIDLIPSDNSATAGKPYMKAGILGWQEPEAAPK